MGNLTINIKGMHCRSCELLVEDELNQVKGVTNVNVNHNKGTADICFSGNNVNYKDIRHAVKRAGYEIGIAEKKPLFSTNIGDYTEIATYGLILILILFMANEMGIFKLADFSSNNFSSLPVVFLIGLTAGISTCAAMVGGLVLGASARYAEQHADVTTAQKFTPHIFFNIGRVVSFFVLGGIIGLVGSIFKMSLTTLGFFTILVGLFMLFLGAQLTGLFPRLENFNVSLPSGIARMFGINDRKNNEYSHTNSLLLGALTFFLPCGFTQVVQLYAISTGNPLSGAMTMGVFALGTTPGLLGIGGITSAVKGGFAKPFYKFAGLIVIAMALFNISNGANLSGLRNISLGSAQAQGKDTNAVKPSGDVQVLKTVYHSGSDIDPKQFTVKAGQPVRMEVDVQDDGFGCMGSFTIPKLTSQVDMLKKGSTLVYEFTPTEPGTYPITCAMGVPRGSITVN